MPVPISSTDPVIGYFPADEPLFDGTQEQLRGSVVVVDMPQAGAPGDYVSRALLVSEVMGTPNASPAAAVHIVRYLRNADRPAGEPTAPTLDTLQATPAVLHLEDEVRVVDPKAGQPSRLVIKYASGGFDCYRDGNNQDTSAGEFVDVASPRSQAQPYAYYGPAYPFLTTDVVRAVPTDAPGAEVFFSPASSGVRPAPTLAAGDANWVRVAPPVVGSASPWRYLGDPTDGNIAHGGFDPSNAVDTTDWLGNTFGFGFLNNTIAAELYGCTFGNFHESNTYGSQISNSWFGPDHYDNAYGSVNVSLTIGANVRNLGVGSGCTNIIVGNECSYVTIGDNCQNVEIYATAGVSGAPFLIPDGTTDAVYRNGALVTTLDPYINALGTIGAAVRDASNTWVYGDLTAFGSTSLRNAGAPPAVSGQDPSILVGTADVRAGMEFDGFTTGSTTEAWEYKYKRRNDGTSGWTRKMKTA